MRGFYGDFGLLHYMHALLHHSKWEIPSRVATKNKNVFGAVTFNTVAKVGVIPGEIVTLILLHKNKNQVSGGPGVGCTKIRIFAFYNSSLPCHMTMNQGGCYKALIPSKSILIA